MSQVRGNGRPITYRLPRVRSLRTRGRRGASGSRCSEHSEGSRSTGGAKGAKRAESAKRAVSQRSAGVEPTQKACEKERVYAATCF